MTRRETFDQIRADLEATRPVFDDAIRRLMDSRPGIPRGQSFDPTGSGGGDGSSATERAALDNDGRARADIKRLDDALRDGMKAARTIQSVLAGYAPRQADPKAKAAASNDNDQLCEHCTRWVKPGNVEPVHRSGDVNGNLLEPMKLGRWCYDFVRSNSRLPSEQEVKRHDNGLQVRVSAA